jgi:Zn-dependent metalloprotease
MVSAAGEISGDPETVARSYLSSALASDQLPTFTAESGPGEPSEFRIIGTETMPLTKSTTVKFRQHYRKIPIYGSLVTVELGEANELLAINSAFGEPSDVEPVAKISPAEAIDVVRKEAGYGEQPLDAVPRLHYYYDRSGNQWRLVYIVEDVVRHPSEQDSGQRSELGIGRPVTLPDVRDYVVDANSGELVIQLPRTASMGKGGTGVADRPPKGPEPTPPEPGDTGGLTRSALGDDDLWHDVRFSRGPQGELILHDDERKVRTHDFKYRDVRTQSDELPGDFVTDPPLWQGGAVSAHTNACEVADFLSKVLRRQGLDNRGEPFVSSVNCKYGPSANNEWENAAWIGTQMVYGQKTVAGRLRSYAVSLDIVAHEIFHGVTERTARLEYAAESGALNESYSDIFGMLISNEGKDIPDWNWLLGEDLDVRGIPLRDLSDPTKHNQPDHMRDYKNLPVDRWNDWGGVHINSGIHNKAAYHLMTAESPDGGYLFTPEELAAIFYIALTQYLTRTSAFADSRQAVLLAIRSLFRSAADLEDRVGAAEAAFDNVGIAQPA